MNKKICIGTGTLLLTLTSSVFADSSNGLLLHESFERRSLQGQRIETDFGGPDGKCLTLSPGQTYPQIQFPAPLDRDYTIAFWVKVDEYPDNGVGRWDNDTPVSLLSLVEAKSQEEWGLLRIDRGKAFFSCRDGEKFSRSSALSQIEAGQWVHVALVREESQVMFYVNGNPEICDTLPEKYTWTAVWLGQVESRRKLRGAMDEWMVFDHALSRREITGLSCAQNRKLFNSFEPTKIVTKPRWGTYPSLQTAEDTVYNFYDQISIMVAVAPWTAPDAADLLVNGKVKWWLFGHRKALFRVIAPLVNGLPVYDDGTTLPNFPGEAFKTILRPNGMFDLVASGNDSVFGEKTMIYLQNSGTPGKPHFEPPVPISMNGNPEFSVSLKNPGVRGSFVRDLDDDGVPDLLIICSIGQQGHSQWPDGVSMHDGKEYPNQGKGRGFDVAGNWLGQNRHSALYWAKGIRPPDAPLAFVDPKMVNYRYKGFAVQWKECVSASAAGAITLNGQLYILFAGNKDRILFMPAHFEDGELFCGDAEPFTAVPQMERTYFPNQLTVADIDHDGNEEVLVDGNPGLIVILKGTRPGEFEEIGCVQMKGGQVRAETLSVPCRADWDNDGFPDLLIGDSSGFLSFWKGTKDPIVYTAPRIMNSAGQPVHHQAGLAGSIQGPSEERWGYLNPTVGDWDGDGLMDVICNDVRGNIVLYRGTLNPGELHAAEPFLFGKKQMPVAWRTRPAVLPEAWNVFGAGKRALLVVDWDGDLSVALPDRNGRTQIERMVKLSGTNGQSVRVSGAGGLWGRAKMTATDWNEDGIWDIVWGTSKTSLKKLMGANTPPETGPLWMKNVGTSEQPIFAESMPIKLVDGGFIELGEHIAGIWPTDLNQDGHLDIIVGAEDGKIYCFYRKDLTWD
jgi:hypothetical protein